MVRFTFILAVTVLLTGHLGATEEKSEITINFDDNEAGKPPTGFSFAVTGEGHPGSWVIMEDATAPSKPRVLAQTSTDKTDYRYPLCIYEKLTAKNVDVAVRFKAVSGKVDQAGGLVVRLTDKDNYYVVRANALEDNVRLYKVKGGRRKQIAGSNVKVSSEEWHTLKLSVSGAAFQVFFDGKMLFEAYDMSSTVAGKIGLWTKADSVTYFDDLVIKVR